MERQLGSSGTVGAAIRAVAGRSLLLCTGFLASAAPFAQTPGIAPGALPGGQRPLEDAPRLPDSRPPADFFELPKAEERDYVDIEQRVQVSRFVAEGDVDFPGLGFRRADIEAFLQDKIVSAGEAGFSIDELQDVARDLSQFLRDRGLPFGTATLPPQTIDGGTVVIRIYGARFEGVVIEGEGKDSYYSTLLEAPFRPLEGGFMESPKLESALLHLNDLPGTRARAIAEPGTAPGSTVLRTEVDKVKRVDVGIRADNHGRPETGDYRTRLEGSLNNPLGIGDRLRGLYQHSAAPQNQEVYFGEYSAAVPWVPGLRGVVSYSRNEFDIFDPPTTDTADFSGRVQEGRLGLEWRAIRSFGINLSASALLARKQATSFVDQQERFTDPLSVVQGRLDFDRRDTRLQGLDIAFVEYHHGIADFLGSLPASYAGSDPSVPPSRRGGSDDLATGDFQSVQMGYTRLQSLEPLHGFFKGHTLLLRLEGQYSGDTLVPLEQYSVGGPYSVRGYLPSAALFDSGYLAQIEYRVPAPGFADAPGPFGRTWGELLQVAAFYDYGGGTINDPRTAGTDVQQPRNLDSAGIWVQVGDPLSFQARIIAATPIRDLRKAGADEPQEKTQIWFESSLAF